VPPDSVRASRCFQKAFELDSREAEAARRLAQGFAEDQDWDLVEIVAHRTIEGEGGLSGGLPFQSSDPDSSRPTNSWAWKAIGIVELVCTLVTIRTRLMCSRVMENMRKQSRLFKPL